MSREDFVQHIKNLKDRRTPYLEYLPDNQLKMRGDWVGGLSLSQLHSHYETNMHLLHSIRDLLPVTTNKSSWIKSGGTGAKYPDEKIEQIRNTLTNATKQDRLKFYRETMAVLVILKEAIKLRTSDKQRSLSRSPGAPKSFYADSEDIRLPSILFSKLKRGAEAEVVYAKYVMFSAKGELDNADKVRMIRASNTANKVIGMINKFMIGKGYDIDGLDLILVSREYVLIKDSGMHKVIYRLVG